MNATTMKPTRSKSSELPVSVDGAWLEILRKQVGAMRFGVVQVVVHEGRVVQIERTEKVRFQSPTSASSAGHPLDGRNPA